MRRTFTISADDKDEINEKLRRNGYGPDNFRFQRDQNGNEIITDEITCEITLSEAEIGIWERITGVPAEEE